MEYTGKLYGKIGNKYFDTGVTTEDYDKLVGKNKISEIKKLNNFSKENPCDCKWVKECGLCVIGSIELSKCIDYEKQD